MSKTIHKNLEPQIYTLLITSQELEDSITALNLSISTVRYLLVHGQLTDDEKLSHNRALVSSEKMLDRLIGLISLGVPPNDFDH